jgi:hypothetical protein
MPMEPIWLQYGCCGIARRCDRCGSKFVQDLESALSTITRLTCLTCGNTWSSQSPASTATMRRASAASGDVHVVRREEGGGDTDDRLSRHREPQDHSFPKRRRSLIAMMSMLTGWTVRHSWRHQPTSR